MDTCPTVKVKADNEQGFVVMNESDFNAEKHELFEKPAKVAASDAGVEKKAETKAEKKAREKAEAEAAATKAASDAGAAAPWK